jgi:low temperature requirement protein LtrA
MELFFDLVYVVAVTQLSQLLLPIAGGARWYYVQTRRS